MKKMKQHFSLAIATTVLTATMIAPQAQASWFKKKSAAQASVPQAASAPRDAQLLNGLVQKISQNFDQLQVLMSQGQYQAALTMAKASLDEARMKTGIDPKSQRREIIAVQDGTFAADYKTMGMSLSDFPIDTQNNIMSSIEAYRGGYFLDLLNLLKRTNLIYIEAFYQTLKQSPQGLMKEDIQKIRNDINAVRAVPLYLKDTKVGSLLLIFDFEVANSDQNYLFNRELKAYLITEGKSLGYNSDSVEQTIDDELKAQVQSIRQNFIRTEDRQTTQVQTDANPFANSNYKKCYDIITYSLSSVRAQNYCLARYRTFNYSNPAFSACYDEAVYSLSAFNAMEHCQDFAKF